MRKMAAKGWFTPSPVAHTCTALHSAAIDCTRVTTNRAELPVRSASFALPLFGVYDGAGKGGYLWSQKHEVE
ncbi:MAG: hypothetical protein ABSE51_05875 [Terracidiphilus sp.]